MGGMEPVRCGVLGTSKFAREWIVPGMMKSLDVRVAAVGSRTRAKADSFAKALGIPMACGSYEDLLNDPNVEAIYNPLPNHLHVPMTIAAMRAGKHVLCEKADCADRRGGSLLDIVVYPVVASRFIFECEPRGAIALIDLDPRFKVDRVVSGIVDFGEGRRVDFTVSTQAVAHQRLEVFGHREESNSPYPSTCP
jgi:predicted dehydrogenase